MAAVRSETQQKMRSYSFELKYLIAGHTKAYQGEAKRNRAKEDGRAIDETKQFVSNCSANLKILCCVMMANVHMCLKA